MEDLKKELGVRIKKYLEENNMTRKEFLTLINNRGANVTASALQFWYNGQKEPRGEVKKILFDVLDLRINDNTFGQVEMVKFPVLGRVACGEPIWSEADKDCFVMADADIKIKYKPDYVLFCKGDSMQPLINDGDIVFIKKQDAVDNGQIAVVLIDDEATLKRVYQDNDRFTLVAENKKYQPMIFTREELEAKNIRICGLAVFNQTLLYNK